MVLNVQEVLTYFKLFKFLYKMGQDFLGMQYDDVSTYGRTLGLGLGDIPRWNPVLMAVLGCDSS